MRLAFLLSELDFVTLAVSPFRKLLIFQARQGLHF